MWLEQREPEGDYIRDEVSDVPKLRPCTFFLAIVRIWVFTLNTTGNPWEGVEWRNHMITLVTLFKVGCREIIPFLFICQAPNLFLPPLTKPCLFSFLNIPWTHVLVLICFVTT